MANAEQIVGNRVFSEIPKYNRKRIFGTENEYGVDNKGLDINRYITNGGRTYFDCGHLEYASPETSNPLSAVVYEKAGELVCLNYDLKLHKNNRDSLGNSFGAHENYFTKADFIKTDFIKLGEIIPFLITRQIYAGAGYLHKEGNFSISQRTEYIKQIFTNSTTTNRGILCTKNESLSTLEGWIRLHLILGDANMCEIADFLKLGTTGLVLDLIEDGLLPKINYKREFAVEDLHNISNKTKNWTIRIGSKEEKAVDVQRLYLESASKAYKGRDEITDEILARWEYTLNALDNIENEPMQPLGELDWLTKKALIDAYAEKNSLSKNYFRLRNIDLQYHDLDREKGLFYVMQKQGKIKRLITNELIKKASYVPPSDTRACIRGLAVKRGLIVDWISIGRSPPDSLYAHTISNPFETYKELESRL